MHARSWGTLLSLAKLHLDVLHVVSHPLRLLLTLHQLSVELRAPLHLRERADNRTSHKKLLYGSLETKISGQITYSRNTLK